MSTSEHLSTLYRQIILDHAQHPRNFGPLEGAVEIALRNPTCGDEVTLFFTVEKGMVQAAHFQGKGCSISIASASMLTEAVRGLRLEDALLLNDQFRKLLQGEEIADETLGDLEALSGVTQFPARIKCALLAWNALQQAIDVQKGGSKA